VGFGVRDGCWQVSEAEQKFRKTSARDWGEDVEARNGTEVLGSVSNVAADKKANANCHRSQLSRDKSAAASASGVDLCFGYYKSCLRGCVKAKGQDHDITGFYFFRLSIQQRAYVIDISPTNTMLRYCRIAVLVPYRALLGFSPATQNPVNYAL
jgi:hypothetical protein